MFRSLGHYGARPQPWEERRRRQRWLELQLQGQELLGMGPCSVRRVEEEEEQDALATRVLARSSNDSTMLAPASLKQRQQRGQEEQEEEEGAYAMTSYHHHYPSSFLSLSSSSARPTQTPFPSSTSPPPPSILALSTTTSAAADAERKRKELMAQLERTLKRAQLVFGPKRPYMADMREPFHHFRAKDLLQCVLRAMLQVIESGETAMAAVYVVGPIRRFFGPSIPCPPIPIFRVSLLFPLPFLKTQASLIPVHRWLDEFLERIQVRLFAFSDTCITCAYYTETNAPTPAHQTTHTFTNIHPHIATNKEAERRAALLDALEENDDAEGLAPEEEEELLRIEMPKLGVYFRNFEWRVRCLQ